MEFNVGINPKVVNQVRQYVYENSDKAISLDELAIYTGFSKYHFNRIFFASTGFQLGEFIQQQKLEKSLHLIKDGEHSIIDVALSVGYDSPSSFSRAFKKNFGVSVDNPWVGEQKQSRFFAGFVEGLSKHHNELESFYWCGGKWACFTHLGPHDTMWQTIPKVYAHWVLPNEVQLKNQQIVQLYKNNPMNTEPHMIQTELYLAVQEDE